MTDGNTTETGVRAPPRGKRLNVDFNWTRIEGILGLGALLTSFLWFLGMPTGMAIGVGFGIVLVMDVIRALLFGPSRSDRTRLNAPDGTQH